MAHAQMLCECKIITKSESNKICKGLQTIQKKYNDGKLSLSINLEDVHMNIEQALTKEVGDLGKKIHMGRSRNDLVSTDLRLYLRDCVDLIIKKIKDTRYAIAITALDNSNVIFPGYTHMQIAMPSSFGLWFAAYAESLLDDLLQLKSSYKLVDKNPLGSAAGYGSSLPLNRISTTEEMGFGGLNVNSIYAQMTRGKMEKSVGFSVNSIAATLSKFAMDVCLYSGQNFNFLTVDKKYTKFATSSGLPNLCIGIFDKISSFCLSFNFSVIDVTIYPGETILTLIFLLATSAAIVL